MSFRVTSVQMLRAFGISTGTIISATCTGFNLLRHACLHAAARTSTSAGSLTTTYFSFSNRASHLSTQTWRHPLHTPQAPMSFGRKHPHRQLAITSQERAHAASLERPAEFWTQQARNLNIVWDRSWEPDKVMEVSDDYPNGRWFVGAQLNTCFNVGDQDVCTCFSSTIHITLTKALYLLTCSCARVCSSCHRLTLCRRTR